MQGLLKRMKDRRDEILPEHKAFLAKKQVALQYTRAVRNYRDQQFNKRAAEQKSPSEPLLMIMGKTICRKKSS